MDCRILRHVTLKANGSLGCDDSIGYDIDLGRVELTPEWSIRDVFNAPKYRQIRTSFRDGKMPWPRFCKHCDLLSNGGVPVDTLDTRLELLVEPTLACTLSCACCMRKRIIAGGRDTKSLNPEILRRFVQSCRAEGIAIDQVHYIGWGEPLLHGDFRALFDIVAEYAPSSNQMVTTAANVDFRATVGDAALQRLVVSCDGATAVSYAKYRRGGDFDTVVRFMRDCRKFGRASIFLEWKFILFEHNDSDEEILAAQALAEEIGVDSLLFVLTNSKWHSQRFTAENLRELPLTSTIASVAPCAAMSAIAMTGKLPGVSLERQPGVIDICSVLQAGFITVEGWAYTEYRQYAEGVELLLDDRVVARTKPNLRRNDVAQAYPAAEGPNCGFFFRAPLHGRYLPEKVEVRVVSKRGNYLLGGRVSWQVPATVNKVRNDLPDADFIARV